MTKTADLYTALQQRWLTPLEAAHEVGVLALAQRVSEWRAADIKVVDRWVKTAGGSRVKAYHIPAADEAAYLIGKP